MLPVSTSKVVITLPPPPSAPWRLETNRVVLVLKQGACKKVHEHSHIQDVFFRWNYLCEINEVWLMH